MPVGILEGMLSLTSGHEGPKEIKVVQMMHLRNIWTEKAVLNRRSRPSGALAVEAASADLSVS